MTNKRGQVSLFIIIAIVIVVVLIFLFLPRIKRIFVPSTPDVQLQDCIEKSLNEALKSVSERGGSISPMNSIMYKDENVEYLCYTNQYYHTCSMQVVLLKQHVEREILDYIKINSGSCIENLKQDLIDKGYSVSSGSGEINVEIVPNNINVIISGFSAAKEDTGERYDKFVAGKKSEIYDLIMLSNSILNWEARYGDSDIAAYMLYYPTMKVEKYKQSEGSKIYILTETKTKEKFVFATRSLAWPAGYGFSEGVV